MEVEFKLDNFFHNAEKKLGDHHEIARDELTTGVGPIINRMLDKLYDTDSEKVLIFRNMGMFAVDEISSNIQPFLRKFIDYQISERVRNDLYEILKIIEHETDVEYRYKKSNLEKMLKEIKQHANCNGDDYKSLKKSLQKLTTLSQEYRILVVDDLYSSLKRFLYKTVNDKDLWFEFECLPQMATKRIEEEAFDLIIVDACLNPFNMNDLTGIEKLFPIVTGRKNLKGMIYSGIPALSKSAEVFAKAFKFSFLPKNLTEEGRESFINRIYKLIEKRIYGVLVTHGTDTMAWGFEVLRYALKNLKGNIVITGSQIPLKGFLGFSDGNPNIKNSFTTISQVSPPGVYVIFGEGKCIFDSNLQKIRKWDCNAFIGKQIAVFEWGKLKSLSDQVFINPRRLIKDQFYTAKAGGTIEQSRDERGFLKPATVDWVDMCVANVTGSCKKKTIEGIFTEDSSNLTLKDWQILADRIVYNINAFLGDYLDNIIKTEDNWQKVYIDEVLKYQNLDEEDKKEITKLTKQKARQDFVNKIGIRIDKHFDNNVQILIITPFDNKELYDKIIELASGLVILGYGAGNVNTKTVSDGGSGVINIIEKMTKENILVVINSQVPYEQYGIEYEVGSRPLELGALPSGDFSPQRCQVKIAYIEKYLYKILDIDNEKEKDEVRRKIKDLFDSAGISSKEQAYRIKKIAFLSGMRFRDLEEKIKFKKIVKEFEDWDIPLIEKDLFINNDFILGIEIAINRYKDLNLVVNG